MQARLFRWTELLGLINTNAAYLAENWPGLGLTLPCFDGRG